MIFLLVTLRAILSFCAPGFTPCDSEPCLSRPKLNRNVGSNRLLLPARVFCFWSRASETCYLLPVPSQRRSSVETGRRFQCKFGFAHYFARLPDDGSPGCCDMEVPSAFCCAARVYRAILFASCLFPGFRVSTFWLRLCVSFQHLRYRACFTLHCFSCHEHTLFPIPQLPSCRQEYP